MSSVSAFIVLYAFYSEGMMYVVRHLTSRKVVGNRTFANKLLKMKELAKSAFLETVPDMAILAILKSSSSLDIRNYVNCK